MSFEKVLGVNNIKQLVDINGDITNFKAKFTVTSIEGKTFQMTIADQNMLDADEPLKYRDVQGGISGNVSSDKNVYTSYYIALKSSEPTQIKIKVELEELPMKDLPYNPQKMSPPNQGNPGIPGNQGNQGYPQGYHPNIQPRQAPAPSQNDDKKQSFIEKNLWKIILIIVILAIGGYFIFQFMKKGKKEKSTEALPNRFRFKKIPIEEV